jgi:DNA repair protein RadC
LGSGATAPFRRLPTPSPEDVQVTRTLVEAGKMMDIEELDHLVIGHGKYVSLKERRLGF